MANARSFAKPYARALFELAVDNVQRGLWMHRLQVLERVFEDPQVGAAVSRKAPLEAVQWLVSILGEGLEKESYALLAILLENRRLSLLKDIRIAFADLTVERHGLGVLYVTTAVALDDQQRAEALAAFEKVFRQKLIPHYRVDSLVRGGMVGQVNDLVFDGSLKGSLEKLRENLLS